MADFIPFDPPHHADTDQSIGHRSQCRQDTFWLPGLSQDPARNEVLIEPAAYPLARFHAGRRASWRAKLQQHPRMNNKQHYGDKHR